MERHLTAAQGYLELDMPREALQELNELSEDLKSHAEIFQLKLVILMRMKEWEQGAELCRKMIARFPKLSIGYIHGAFCLHELGRTAEAKSLLISGPSSLLREATYHYNLACYEAVLGNLDEAKQYLQASFSMDHHFRAIAQRDPDLHALTEFF
jgi:predicted Zn-dependent protease